MKNVFRTIRALSDGLSPPKGLTRSPAKSPSSPSSPRSASSSPRRDEVQYAFVVMGPGDVGKNTLVKQFCKDAKEFTERDIQFYKNEVYVNFIVTVGRLYDCMEKYDLSFDNNEVQEFAKKMSKLSVSVTSVNLNYNTEMHEKMLEVFNDEQFQRYLSRYFYEAHCPEGIHYFINKKEDLFPEIYTPDFEDILHIRRKTSGVFTNTIEYKGTTVSFTVLTGQQCERKKWNSILHKDHILIYVVSASDFDQTLYEDETQNRQLDSLDVFEQYIAKEVFANRMVFVVFNKVDIFKTKYQTKDLSICFPDFNKEQYPTADDALKYLESQYRARYSKHRSDMSNLFMYQTSAIDEDSQFILERIYTECLYEPSMQPSTSTPHGSPSKRSFTPRGLNFGQF